MFKSKFLMMAIVLVLAWLAAVLLFHVAAFLLKALLLIAAILFIAHFFSRWREAARRN